MGYVRVDNTWVLKTEKGMIDAPPSLKIRPSSPDDVGPSLVSMIILNFISGLEVKLDSLKDLLLVSHFQMDKI